MIGFELSKKIQQSTAEDSVVALIFEAVLAAVRGERVYFLRAHALGAPTISHSTVAAPPANEPSRVVEAATIALATKDPEQTTPPYVMARALDAGGRTHGVLVVVRKGDFAPEDRRAFTLVAHHAAYGLGCRNTAPPMATAPPAAKTTGALIRMDQKLEAERTRVRTRRLERSEVTNVAERFPEIIGQGPAHRRLLEQIVRFGATDLPVLILGETGTGKELIARAIHKASPRASGPFLPINAAALPPELIESELFDEKGALRAPAGGTIFMDEIGELPLALQPKLLKVLQGELPFRFVAGSPQFLSKLVTESRFKQDLYYRLSALEILSPPLRERREDLRLLVDHFIAAHGSKRPALHADAWAVLDAHPFPGNVGQLHRALERALALGSDPIRPLDLGLDLENVAVVHDNPLVRVAGVWKA